MLALSAYAHQFKILHGRIGATLTRNICVPARCRAENVQVAPREQRCRDGIADVELQVDLSRRNQFVTAAN